MHAPVGRLGGDDIEVAVDQQCTAAAVGTGKTDEDVAATRRAGLDVLGGVPDRGQLLGDPEGTLRLTLGGGQLTGVGGVEPDQGADEIDDLVDGLSHSPLSYHWRGRPVGAEVGHYHKFPFNHSRNTPI